MYPRILLFCLLVSGCAAFAQAPANGSTTKITVTATSPPAKECGISAVQVCALHVMQDEWGIVTAPVRLRQPDAPKVIAFGLGTTLAVATDVNAMEELGVNPSREHNASKYSDYAGLYAPAVFVSVGYFVGKARHDRRFQETTILAEEAMVDSFILNTGLGYAFNRETPTEGNGKGALWPHGPSTWPDGQSMPSDHSILAWSFARVVASEYPGFVPRVAVYSLAASVSAARVIGRKHFPSDVFVGGVLGYYIGGYVIHRRARELPVKNDFSLSPIRTPNGTGIELSYNFSH
jgi:PAP2 superfamily